MKSLKKYAVNLSNRSVWLTVFTFLFFASLKSQIKDTTTHQLLEVIILPTKQEQFETSKKHIAIDSSILSRYNTSSLAELLASQSTIHIKSYGKGNIVSTSMRGGNANHTALLWNGLNIQNTMLGQPDLSIVPTSLFNNVSLEYGGGSAIWGSGAIGGSIHLQNNSLFNQGFKTRLQMGIGSFGSKKITSGIVLSYKKIVSNTTIYYNTCDNNYTYKDTADKESPVKQITHANYISKGLMQEVSFLATPFQKVNMRLWYNVVDRNLPSYTSVPGRQNQLDQNLKLNADWNYSKRHLNSTIRLGYFDDKLNYNDTLANYLVSNNTIKTFILESDNTYKYKKHLFNVGANFTNYESLLYSASGGKDTSHYYYLTKLAFFAAYKLSLLQSKLNYNLAIRKEFTSETEIPFTGNTGVHYQILKQLAAKVNANTSYRQPSLSDLHWNPGGNPNLKPEEGYEIDGGLEFNYSKNNFHVLIEATYFNRHLTNWIIWLQGDKGYVVPKNIAEVYSRGTETKTELYYSKKDILLKLVVNTSYVLSTNQKRVSENDNSVGRQLIYTPRYNGQATFVIKYKALHILFNNSYTGYRFTSTDNTNWLNPYYIANLKCAYDYSFSSVNMEIFGSVNNLFNKNYVVVANRPMPLRNYEVGLSINYHKKKKQPTNNILK
jgi:vitamin B12 transporter